MGEKREKEGEETRGTYFEEIFKNDIRFILSELNNTLRETLVHKDALPAGNS
jgi:hypothetical protein